MFLCHFLLMNYDSEIWGPHYWFTLFTISMTYPKKPTNVSKKKYYDFFSNLPLFLPTEEASKLFVNLLDKYPVTPYLDSKDSLMRWVHFIHNRVNDHLGKQTISYKEALYKYKLNYIVTPDKPDFWTKDKINFIIFIVIFLFIIVLCFKNETVEFSN